MIRFRLFLFLVFCWLPDWESDDCDRFSVGLWWLSHLVDFASFNDFPLGGFEEVFTGESPTSTAPSGEQALSWNTANLCNKTGIQNGAHEISTQNYKNTCLKKCLKTLKKKKKKMTMKKRWQWRRKRRWSWRRREEEEEALSQTCISSHIIFLPPSGIPSNHITQESWTQVYTDGSAENAVRNGGAGVYIHYPGGREDKTSLTTGLYSTNYKTEAEALKTAAAHIKVSTHASHSVVLLIDALSVLWALQSNRDTDHNDLSTALASLCRNHDIVTLR